MVFYLKYRPQTLKDLDNAEVRTLIGKYVARESVPHAFLFIGPRGTGKTSTARILAKSLNCEKRDKGQACGTCPTCKSIGIGSELDVLEIDAASNRGIDEIRELRQKIKLAPVRLPFKVYIIDEVHMLTTEAFNALLKTLEEPPRHAIFILATTEAHKVPETILSRCVQVRFHKASAEELLHALKRIVAAEKLKAEEDALVALAAAADGSFRDAAKFLEEVALEHETITLTAIQAKLGLVDAVLETEFLQALQKKAAPELLELIGRLVQEGKNMPQFFQRVIAKLEQLLIDSFNQKSDWERHELLAAIHALTQAFIDLKLSPIPALPFEVAVVEFCESKSTKATAMRPQAQVVMHSHIEPQGEIDTSSASPVATKWNELLEGLKPYNHSVAGVLRSCRPLTIADGTLTIEANYKFHAERLNDGHARDLIAKVVNEITGLDVKINVVLKKKV